MKCCEYCPGAALENAWLSTKFTKGPNKLECLSVASFFNELFSLLVPFTSYEENEVLWIRTQGPGADVIKLYLSIIYEFSY